MNPVTYLELCAEGRTLWIHDVANRIVFEAHAGPGRAYDDATSYAAGDWTEGDFAGELHEDPTAVLYRRGLALLATYDARWDTICVHTEQLPAWFVAWLGDHERIEYDHEKEIDRWR